MNSTEYPVQVKLSTVGGGDVKSTLENLSNASRLMAANIADANAQGIRLSQTFRSATQDGEKYSLTMRQMKDDTKKAVDSWAEFSKGMGYATAVVGGATAAVGLMTAGLAALADAYWKLVEPGIEFNSFLEKNKLALSAMTLSFGKYVDAAGVAVDETEQWRNATLQAGETQQMLMKQSLQSAASFQDLARVYQMMSGAMIAGGAKTAEQMVTFTGTVVDMAAVMGTSYDKAARQMTLALMGVTRTTGQLGAMLRSMGVDNNTLRSWREQGIVVEELQKKLEAFRAMQPMLQNTWVGITTNMKTAWQEFTGAVAESTFEPLKKTMQDMLHNVLDFTTGGMTTAAKNVAAALGAAVKSSFEIMLSTAKTMLSLVTATLQSNSLTWLDILKGFAELTVFIVENVSKGLLAMTSAVTHPIDTMAHATARLLANLYEGMQHILEAIAFVSKSGVGNLVGIGPGLDQIALPFAAGLERAANQLRILDALANPTTKKLADGFAAIDAQVLKAYTDIQKVGKRVDGGTGSILDADNPSPSFGTKDTYKPDKVEKDLSKLEEAFRKFVNSWNAMAAKLDTAGLDGIDQALARNAAQFEKDFSAIDNFSAHMLAAADAANNDALFEGVVELEGYLVDLAKAAKRLNDEKAIELWALKFEESVSKMNSIAMDDTALDKVEKKWNDNLRKLTDDFENAKRALGSAPLFDFADVDSMTKFMEWLGKRGQMEAAYVDAVKRNDEQLRLGKQKLHAEQLGDYKAYYDAVKQMAINAGATEFQAAQEASKKSAEMLDKQAQTFGQGLKAGIAAIFASITSFGQDTRDLVVSMWGDLTSAFQEGFYDILTGKISSLGDVFKNLFDSILKDFSKMLAQMVTRWLMTGDALGNGQGSNGIFGKLLTGIFGDNSVYTPGGTANNGAGATVGLSNQGGIPGLQGGAPLVNGQQGGLGAQGYGAIAGYVGGAVLAYNAFKNSFTKTGPADMSYNGTSLGQSTDFGGNAKFGDFAAAAAAIGAASMAAAGVAALAAAAVPVIGWIAAAAILVVGAIISIINGPKEGHFYVAISDAFDKSGARSAVGNFVHDIMDSTANFVGELAMKAVGPEGVQKFVTAYNQAFKDALGNAKFDFHAGDGGDLNKDVTDFFNKTLPKMAMQAAFGQIGYGPHGSSDGPGGVAGMDWNLNNQFMDKDGNWIKKQLYDPNAPIPTLLSGIGFSADKINDIALKLSTSQDMAAFKQYLTDLVSIVAGFGDLAKQAGRSASEWQEYFTTQGNAKGTAAEFKTQIANLKGSGTLMATLTGDEQIAAAKQLLQDSGDLMNKLASALQSIFTMIDNIKTTTAATIQSYRDKLLSPSELEAAARGRIAGDFEAIAKAANPEQVQQAWQTVMKDLSQVLDAIVARIQSIKALQQGYADFRAQMAKDAGPQFGTDPFAWLAQNATDIAQVTNDLATGTGDAVVNSQKLLDLTKERYNNELAMLARVNAAIQAIQDQHDQTNQNLEMQAMGHVEVDPQTGKKTWVQDTHAQGEYLKQQYDTLMGQLGSAKTPEEVQSIYNKLQGIISQLAAQPQDPEHYAESRRILQGMNDDSTRVAQELLKKWGKTLETDLSTVGGKLKAGETALAGALDSAQKDFEKYLGLMNDAAANSTDALNLMAATIIATMTDLGNYMTHWSFVMSHGADEKDPNWDYEKNEPKGGKTPVNAPPPTTTKDVWQDDPDDPTMQICVSGPSKGQKRVKPAPGGGPGTSPENPVSATPPISLAVTVNAGAPEDIANAAADLVYTEVYKLVDAKQLALVRMLKQNQVLLAPQGA